MHPTGDTRKFGVLVRTVLIFERESFENDGSHSAATQTLHQAVKNRPSRVTTSCASGISRKPLENA